MSIFKERMAAPEVKVPNHIGIIMDGNRRFAKQLMLKPWKGHEWGAKKVEELLEWLKELKIKEVTLYTMSIQNFNRPKQEFDYLMNLFRNEFKKLQEKENQVEEKGTRINFIGRLNMLPEDIQKMMQDIMKRTKEQKQLIVNFAIAYGGREEVLDATVKIGQAIKDGKIDIKDINEELFDQTIYNSSEPDLIIRTGGERRTSNFLIWQSHYSEWFFLEKRWPEFAKEDFLECISEYSNRHRRYGQ